MSSHPYVTPNYDMEQETLLPSHDGSIDDNRDDLLEDFDRFSPPDHFSRKRSKRSGAIRIGLYICLCAVGLIVGLFGSTIYTEKVSISSKTAEVATCKSPSIRREWRSLSIAERDAYIDAVFCLRAKPSRLNTSQTLYDDFAYVHHQFDEESKSTVLVQELRLTETPSTLRGAFPCLASVFHPCLSSHARGSMPLHWPTTVRPQCSQRFRFANII